MLFRVQRYLEDNFERRGLSDPDQFAVRLANIYAVHRASSSKTGFCARMSRVRTVFFKANQGLSRGPFLQQLLDSLDARFKKKRMSRHRTRVSTKA